MKKTFFCSGKPVSLLILAGGDSRRMKKDKALLNVGGKPLIERVLAQLDSYFEDILVCVSKGQQFDFLSYKIIEDREQNQGPLMGIMSGMTAAHNEACAVFACDIPDIDLALLERLIKGAENQDIAVPVWPDGKYEPLFAVYKKTVLPEIQKLLDSGIRTIIPLFDRCKTRKITIKDAQWFKNLNTPEDYQNYLKLPSHRNKEHNE
jgi:molybdopterin-guanine dinucleotide biosynthesis protein A